MTQSAALAPVTQASLALLADELDAARDYVAQAKSENTRRAYLSDWAGFSRWTAAKGLSALDVAPEHLALYLAGLAQAGRKVAGIERALAAIVYRLRSSGRDWPKAHPAVREVMAGIRRTHGTAPAKKAPVGELELAAIVATLGSDLGGLRDRALLLLGWFGAFRRSELVALDVADLDVGRDGIVVTLRRSKTDQEGQGYTKGLPYAGAPELCPVRALQAWKDAAGITAGPVFRSVDRHGRVSAERLSDRTVARIVQRAAEAAGLDASRFAGHSLRAGFATTAARKGKSLDAIMRQTGHRSERIARGYIRHATVFVDNAATGLL